MYCIYAIRHPGREAAAPCSATRWPAGLDPSLSLPASPGGKPVLPGLHFSLSHSGAWAGLCRQQRTCRR